MFLRIFKSQHPAIIILAFLILILLWLGKLINYDSIEPIAFSGQSILFDKIYNSINNPFLYFLIPILSIIVQFIIIIRFNVKFVLYDTRSYLPAILYILLSSSMIILQGMYPVFFAAPIVLFSIFLIFSSFKTEKPFSEIFLSTFMLAISSMFFHYTIYFIVFIWISLFIIRSPNFREIFISILGLIVPYLLLLTYLFVYDEIPVFITGIESIYSNIPRILPIHYSNYIFLGIVLFLFILTMMFTFNGIYIKKIDSRKFFKTLVVFLLISIVLYLIFHTVSFFILIAIPLSFLIPIFLLSWKNKLFTEIIFTIFVLSVIFLQFAIYFGIG